MKPRNYVKWDGLRGLTYALTCPAKFDWDHKIYEAVAFKAFFSRRLVLAVMKMLEKD